MGLFIRFFYANKNFHKFCLIYLPVNKLFYFDLHASAGSFMVLQVSVHVTHFGNNVCMNAAVEAR